MADALPPLPDPLVMVNRYGISASTADGDGGVFTADQMRAYAAEAVRAALSVQGEPFSAAEIVLMNESHGGRLFGQIQGAAPAAPAVPPKRCEWTNCPTRVGNVCCNDRAATSVPGTDTAA